MLLASSFQAASKFFKSKPAQARPNFSKKKAWISFDSLGNYILDVENPVCHSPAADPKSGGAPEEIEVTDRMIDAGTEVLSPKVMVDLDQMFAGDRGDPSCNMQDYEGCAGWAGAEPHA